MSLTPQIAILAVFLGVLLICAMVGAMILLFGGSRERRRRLQRAAANKSTAAAMASAQASLRRDELDGNQKGLERLLRKLLPGHRKLRALLGRTGYDISLSRYVLISLVLALLVGFVLYLASGGKPWLALGGGLAVGWLLPRLVVGTLAARRLKRFLLELPDAIDVVVRGLKSGLPISEMVATVASDFDGPIGQEFSNVSNHIRFGRTIDEALWTVAERLDIPEFNFLAISVGVQRESGGNLTETLRNLSDLLRKRQQMRLKVKALSSEARASAYIVGGLPFVMLGLMFALNPDYIGRLFEDPRGHMMLAGALASETIGALVMIKMVRFEI